MEKYADTLESLVSERTTQLAEEKKKTEALLLRMLPKLAPCLALSPVKGLIYVDSHRNLRLNLGQWQNQNVKSFYNFSDQELLKAYYQL